MADKVEIRVYEFSGYRVTDLYNDKIIAKNEVQIKVKPDQYRELTGDEWTKFTGLKTVRTQYHFTPIFKSDLNGETIIRLLETNHLVLQDIIKEMGGVGYVTLALESHLLKVPAEKTAMASTRLRSWEDEHNATLYVHLAQKMGWNVRLYKFNNHVVVIFEDGNLPSGRVIIESTDGLITSINAYKQNDQIPCLKLGAPISAFERPPESSIASVILQRINDLEKEVAKNDKNRSAKIEEALRYLRLLDQLQPEDISIYMLFQIFLGQAGKSKEAEEWREKGVALIEQLRQKDTSP